MSQQLASIQPIKLEPFIDPQNARTMAAQPLPNLTVSRGTILGMVSAAGPNLGKVGPYAAANADGTQVPIGPSVYDFTTDANGVAVYGPAAATFGLSRGFELTVPYYWKGTFLETDLTGLDANAVTKLVAREIGIGPAKMLHIG